MESTVMVAGIGGWADCSTFGSAFLQATRARARNAWRRFIGGPGSGFGVQGQLSANRRGESKMPVGQRRGGAAARRAVEEALLDEERLVDLLERAGVLAHRHRHG